MTTYEQTRFPIKPDTSGNGFTISDLQAATYLVDAIPYALRIAKQIPTAERILKNTGNFGLESTSTPYLASHWALEQNMFNLSVVRFLGIIDTTKEKMGGLGSLPAPSYSLLVIPILEQFRTFESEGFFLA